MFDSKLVSEPLTYQDDWRLPDWGLGLTNIIQRPSAGIDVLKPREYIAGRKRLIATVKHYRPHVVALLGVTIYRTLFPEYRTGRVSLGMQDKTLADRPVFVLPNPSGRNAHFSYRTMLTAFRALRNATNKPASKYDEGNDRGRMSEPAVANFSQALCCRDNRMWPNCEASSIKKAFPKTYAPP